VILASVTLSGIPWSARVSVRFHGTNPEPAIDYLTDFRVWMFGRELGVPITPPDHVLESLAAVAFAEFAEMTAADLARHCEP